MVIRDASTLDVEVLARLWHDGWQDAHARILPAELARHRTLDSFAQRLGEALTSVRVAVAQCGVVGFVMTHEDELYQLYVAAASRGAGVAAALLADGERTIAKAHATAWLACGIGNDRAARFYAKHGWRSAGTMVSELPTPDGVFRLEVWRFEKMLPG